MLKSEYPELLPGPDSKALADAVVDASDLVLQLARGKKLSRPAQKIGKVAVHVPCHNRVQNIGYRGRDLLKWAGADVQMVDRCCGMDGTWGMKKEFFAESLKVAEKAARAVEGAEFTQVWAREHGSLHRPKKELHKWPAIPGTARSAGGR